MGIRDAMGKIAPWECPACGAMTREYPALSRRDNRTNICPECGQREAMDDFNRANKSKQNIALTEMSISMYHKRFKDLTQTQKNKVINELVLKSNVGRVWI